ncbi:MAG TPA: hypothetical protein V6C58_09345 [Allocoleopsis sp.]
MIVKFIIKHYPSTGDGVWSSNANTITDAFNVRASMAMGTATDVCSFRVPNNRNKNISVYKRQDKIELYLSKNNASADSSTLIMTGLIKNITEQITDRGKHLIIDAVSFSEVATNALVFATTGTSHSMDVMEFLQACLNSVATRNENFNVTWDTSNPSQKWNATAGNYTGGAFPTLNSGNEVREFDKSLAFILDKYLTDGYTGDDKYFWYINKDNKLIIRKRVVDTSTSTLTEGVDFKTGKFTYDIKDVKNYVIVKCGMDIASPPRPITTRADDPVSRAKHGFKYYMLVDKTISEKVFTRGNYGGTNAGFREAVKAEGRRVGEDFIRLYSNGVYTATLSLPPTMSYTIGDKVSITAPSFGLTSKALRIKEVMWDIDSTTLTLIEEVAV